MFKRFMILSTVISGAMTALAILLFVVFPNDLSETLAITFATCFYHFFMRMIVGAAWSPFQKHNCHAAWFQPLPFEKRLYKALRVKHWKGHLPTYDPSLYDTQIHSAEEIVHAMCHSELVHETIIMLSFVPLSATVWFGAFPVFLLTSLSAALFDLLFVIAQRYNRPRVMRVANRKRRMP